MAPGSLLAASVNFINACIGAGVWFSSIREPQKIASGGFERHPRIKRSLTIINVKHEIQMGESACVSFGCCRFLS